MNAFRITAEFRVEFRFLPLFIQAFPAHDLSVFAQRRVSVGLGNPDIDIGTQKLDPVLRLCGVVPLICEKGRELAVTGVALFQPLAVHFDPPQFLNLARVGFVHQIKVALFVPFLFHGKFGIRRAHGGFDLLVALARFFIELES